MKASLLHLDNPGADATFMFADTVHPTTHLNAIFAEFVEQQIDKRRWNSRFDL